MSLLLYSTILRWGWRKLSGNVIVCFGTSGHDAVICKDYSGRCSSEIYHSQLISRAKSTQSAIAISVREYLAIFAKRPACHYVCHCSEAKTEDDERPVRLPNAAQYWHGVIHSPAFAVDIVASNFASIGGVLYHYFLLDGSDCRCSNAQVCSRDCLQNV